MQKKSKKRQHASKKSQAIVEKQNTLYKLLDVSSTATYQQIRSQYKKLVLIYHPDKNKQDPNAREKFQKLKEAYDILIDQQKRKQYDETGIVGSNFSCNDFESAYQYFRSTFKKITEEDIIHFSQNYKKGYMQQEDLIDFYEKKKGDMTYILEHIPLSTNQDLPRFIQFYNTKINQNILKKYKIYAQTIKKIKPLPNQKEEFEQQRQRNLANLTLAIQNKNRSREVFIEYLEEKYRVGRKQKYTEQKQ